MEQQEQQTQKTERVEQKQNKQQQQHQSSFTINRFLLKVKYSFYSMLVFFIFANPETFLLMNNAIGRYVPITHPSGVPTAAGFFLHAGLFFCTMLGLMLLPAE